MFCILPSTAKRVKENTSKKDNEKIKRETLNNISEYIAGGKNIDERLKQLDSEWDVERFLEANAAIIVFICTLLGIKRNKLWLAISLTVSIFLLEHALQGWCPPLPLLRKIGVRTEEEIFNEKTALKIHRGDFSAESSNPEILLSLSEK
ncbi:MAG TPA: DUF2892 domain-containing protein [Ruminiclostridium sp.]|nr:DUF2892 domain-containing protein [Ruminiclostridium sp.]